MAVSTSVASTPPCNVPAGLRCSSPASKPTRARPSPDSSARAPSRPANPLTVSSSATRPPYPAIGRVGRSAGTAQRLAGLPAGLGQLCQQPFGLGLVTVAHHGRDPLAGRVEVQAGQPQPPLQGPL